LGEGCKVTDVTKLGGSRWKSLSEEEKSEWNSKASVSEPQTKRVLVEKWEFSLKDSEGDEEEYEGWSGVNVGYFLEGKTVNGFKRGSGVFMTLREAIEEGNRLGKECGGVVKGKNGYSLRLSGEMKKVTDEVMSDYIKCWVKKDLEGVATYEEKKSKSKVKKILKAKDEKKEEVKPEEIFKEEDEEEEEEVVEEDDEEEEEEEEEDCSVVPWTFKGKTYLLDEKTGVVYDEDTEDEIGKKTKGGRLVLKK
jgi:hypothetical protein